MANLASKSPEIWLPFLRENLKNQLVGEKVWKKDTSSPSAEVLEYMVKNKMLDGKTSAAVSKELSAFDEERKMLRNAAMASVL
jgi:hypothetical protein